MISKRKETVDVPCGELNLWASSEFILTLLCTLGRAGKAIKQAVKGKDAKLQPNSSDCYVRGLTKGELTEMIGLDLSKRNNPSRAVEAFEQLAEDGMVDLERDGSLFRIFGRSS